MAKDYRPDVPFNVAALLQISTMKTVKGVKTKVYPEEGKVIFCSFRTFGGTEKVVNDMLVVEDTAVVETWYNPNIQADCRLLINGTPFEILGTPENINFRNQYLRFKVKAVKGGA